MPWITLPTGERKKVACGPCIRGHRSSKCEHHDRVLLEVRKPGRPLSSCPHPSGSCGCERIIVNYTIPKTSQCPGPPATAVPVVSSGVISSRVQKTKSKKPGSPPNAAALEQVLKEKTDLVLDPTAKSEPPQEKSSVHTTLEASTPQKRSRKPATQAQLPTAKRDGTKINTSPTPSQQDAPVDKPDSDLPSPSEPSPSQGKGKSCCSSKETDAQVQQPPKASSCCSSKPAIENAQSMPPPPLPAPPQKPGDTQGEYKQGHQRPDRSLPESHPSIFNNPSYGSVQSAGFVNVSQSPLDFSSALGTPTNGFADPYSYSLSPYPAFQSNLPSVDGWCSCGDGCTCLGCASHPNNETTVDYVRTHVNYMLQHPYESPPASTAERYGAQDPLRKNQQMSFNFSNGVSHFSDAESSPYKDLGPFTGLMSPANPQAQWHNGSDGASIPATPSSELANFHLHDQRRLSYTPQGFSQGTSLNGYYQQGDSLNATSNGGAVRTYSSTLDSTGSPTLPPSSFFLQQLVLPGCSDPTGTCQCGDGCQCSGCLTHGGHIGVPLGFEQDLQPPAGSEFSQGAGQPSNLLDMADGTHSCFYNGDGQVVDGFGATGHGFGVHTQI